MGYNSLWYIKIDPSSEWRSEHIIKKASQEVIEWIFEFKIRQNGEWQKIPFAACMSYFI